MMGCKLHTVLCLLTATNAVPELCIEVFCFLEQVVTQLLQRVGRFGGRSMSLAIVIIIVFAQ